MTTFTGYEPKNVPISLGPAGTFPNQAAGSASDPAAGQIVQAEQPDTLASDLGSLIDHSMISVEDFLEEPIVPIAGSGKPRASTNTQIVPTIARGNPEPENTSSSSAGGNPIAEQNEQLRQELHALRYQLNETRVIAENYAQHVQTKSHLKAEEALSYQKDAFEKKAEEYSFTARDICQSEVAHSNARLEAEATSIIREQNEQLNNASNIVTNLRQHLTQARQVAEQEAQDKLNLENKATAELDAQKATSLQQQSTLRSSLEQIAQSTHERILKEREDEIKSEAETRHAAGMSALPPSRTNPA